MAEAAHDGSRDAGGRKEIPTMMSQGWKVGLVCLVPLAACGKSSVETKESSANPASPPVAQAASSAVAAAGTTRLTITSGEGSFLIDAPLEKIKGVSSDVSGTIDLLTDHLAKSHGEIRVRLSTLRTTTFEEADKNETQTGHARNWMEVGSDSPADRKAQFDYARFVFSSVEIPVKKLSEVAEQGGQRSVSLKATGDFTAHGVTSAKTVPLLVTFRGPAERPTQVDGKSEQPFALSLKEHDIKPRDTIGKFLNGALEKVGKKIDDKVQVSVTFSAKAAG